MVSWSHAASAEPAELAAPAAIVCPRDAEYQERLAAKEIRRYVYLRTGVLLPVVRELGPKASIVVGSKGQPLVRRIATAAKLSAAVDGLGPEQYWLKTVPRGSEGGARSISRENRSRRSDRFRRKRSWIYWGSNSARSG